MRRAADRMERRGWRAGLLVLAAVLAAAAPAAASEQPRFEPSGPDAATYGEAAGYPVGGYRDLDAPDHLIGSYSHFDAIFPARGVVHPAAVWAFRRAAAEPDIHYLWNGKSLTLADYLAHVHATGLLVARDDTILLERYRYGRTDRDRFTSASMAKTLIALLMGVAVQDGRIRSLDDQARSYVPALGDSPYGQARLRDLLHMASGVAAPDRAVVDGLYAQPARGDAAMLAGFRDRAAPAGSTFRYACGDTEVLALVLRAAVDRPLSAYMSEKIWQPIGAEQDASWVVDRSGMEVGCYGFNATLRDWGRLGRLLADGGSWNGRQVIPRDWLVAATAAGRGTAQPRGPEGRLGYGYQLWVMPGGHAGFALVGAEGQLVLVDPQSRLVMVQMAVGEDMVPVATGRSETLALWRGLVHGLAR